MLGLSRSTLISLLLIPGVFSSPAVAPIVQEREPTPEPNVRVRRHLRPDDGFTHNALFKRADAPDLGAVAQPGNNGPQPIRGGKGDTFLQTSNTPIDLQNPDNWAAPPTDAGTVPNLKWSFSLSHTRLLKGGWVREQAITDLPVSKDIAAAELRLSPYAYRELHWHRVAEWAYVLNGTARIAAVDENGKNYVSDLNQGDIWYFPKGIGHSIQALDKGLEFLVIFADGNFDAAGTTFMLSDWLNHVPREILAQNFGVNASTFANIPATDPYILPSTAKPPSNPADQTPKSPAGTIPNPFVYELSKVEATKAKGGFVKIADSSNFPAATEIASALVHIDVGGLRELHWHPLGAEWLYIVQGKARITAFPGGSAARTFDFQAGDTGVLPDNWGHYVANIGDEPVVILEIFKNSKFADISATQWLALTPHQVVADLLNVTTDVVDKFPTEKQLVVAKQ